MKIGGWTIRITTIALILVLVASATLAAFLVRSEVRAGGMENKWVFHDTDSYGNRQEFRLLYIDSRGSIIGHESWSAQPCFVAIDPNGTILWKSVRTNALPWPVEGPDGGYYYVDWQDRSVWENDPSLAAWCNITTLDANGNFRWDYVVANGTLDLWSIYPDGEVIAHHFDYYFNESLQRWVTAVDRIIAISNDGTESWSLDLRSLNVSMQNPRVSDNGTFLVNAYNASGTCEIGISEDGSQFYVVEKDYFFVYRELLSGTNGTTYYEVRKEFIDNETSVISVYAMSMIDGSLLWKTLLHYSDNPDHTMEGVATVTGTLVDDEGRIYCDDVEDKFSYSLNSSGAILWQKPFLGPMIDVFPSGGLLALDHDYSSIMRINVDGSIAWRHYVRFDGYSSMLLASDETVYYNYGTSIFALVPSTGLSKNVLFLLVLVAVDIVAVISYGVEHWTRRRGPSKA